MIGKMGGILTNSQPDGQSDYGRRSGFDSESTPHASPLCPPSYLQHQHLSPMSPFLTIRYFPQIFHNSLYHASSHLTPSPQTSPQHQYLINTLSYRPAFSIMFHRSTVIPQTRNFNTRQAPSHSTPVLHSPHEPRYPSQTKQVHRIEANIIGRSILKHTICPS